MTKQLILQTRATLRCCQFCVQYFDCPGGASVAVMSGLCSEKQ